MTERIKKIQTNEGMTWLLSGDWTKDVGVEIDKLKSLTKSSVSTLHLSIDQIDSWGGNLVCFLFTLKRICSENDIPVTLSGVPTGAQQLLDIAESVPERDGASRSGDNRSAIEILGDFTIATCSDIKAGIEFTGDFTLSCIRLGIGKARFSFSDFMVFMRDCGPTALPIITLITFLVGLILAFVGAIQLRLFGVEIFVADLVGIGMVRSLGSIMAAVVMAGRTGAAYAAQLGTMQVNEEIDALETMGISPIDFLVLPRMISLILIMPLLCIFADLMGVLGGMFVGVFMLDISPLQYYQQSIEAIRMQDFLIGIVMSIVFGFLVSGAGCLRGMQCGRSSAAVGKATTSAVVTGIVCIILSTALITVICDFLGV